MFLLIYSCDVIRISEYIISYEYLDDSIVIKDNIIIVTYIVLMTSSTLQSQNLSISNIMRDYFWTKVAEYF